MTPRTQLAALVSEALTLTLLDKASVHSAKPYALLLAYTKTDYSAETHCISISGI